MLSLQAADVTADNRPVVKIGICSALSGEMSYIGKSTVGWQKYALEKIAEKNPQLEYKVYLEDDQMQAKQAILAAKRLVELEGVNVLISYGSPSGSVISTYADQKKIPHLGLGYNPAIVKGNYSVSFMCDVQTYVPAFLKLIAKKGYKNFAVFYVRNASWQPVYEELHRLEKEGNFKITYDQVYTPGERDFRIGIQMLPKEKVDAVLLLAWSPEVKILASRFREQKLDKPIIAFGGACVMSGDYSGDFDGAIDIMSGDLTFANEMNRKLTGEPIYSPAGALAYDQIMITADIYEKYYKTHKKLIPAEDFIAEVKKLKDYKSLLGPISCLPSKFFSFQPNYYKMESGGFKVVDIDQL